MNRAINCVFLSSHVNAASNESNHSASRPNKTQSKRAFFRSSYSFWMLFSFVVGLLPNERLILDSNKRMNAVGSSLESIPIKFYNAKSGYATVFAIFHLTSLVAPILFNFVLFAIHLSFQVASICICSFVYRFITQFYCDSLFRFVITIKNMCGRVPLLIHVFCFE